MAEIGDKMCWKCGSLTHSYCTSERPGVRDAEMVIRMPEVHEIARLRAEVERLDSIVRNAHGALADAGVSVPPMDALIGPVIAELAKDRDEAHACIAQIERTKMHAEARVSELEAERAIVRDVLRYMEADFRALRPSERAVMEAFMAVPAPIRDMTCATCRSSGVLVGDLEDSSTDKRCPDCSPFKDKKEIAP